MFGNSPLRPALATLVFLLMNRTKEISP